MHTGSTVTKNQVHPAIIQISLLIRQISVGIERATKFHLHSHLCSLFCSDSYDPIPENYGGNEITSSDANDDETLLPS